MKQKSCSYEPYMIDMMKEIKKELGGKSVSLQIRLSIIDYMKNYKVRREPIMKVLVNKNYRMPETLIDQMKSFSEQNNIGESTLVRNALRFYLNSQGNSYSK